MNIIYTICVSMFASALLMVSFVWFKYIKHTRSADYKQIAENDNFTEETYYNQEILAA